MVKGNSKFLKGMRTFTLGYMGGMIFVLCYIRYVFYDQMMETLGCTNAQLGFLNTVFSIINFIVLIPGSYLSDVFEVKKVVVVSIGGMTACTFLYAFFINSYAMACVVWGLQAIVLMSYWPCLMKYINNLGTQEEAGNSFGMYYMINGLSGAVANALPLWVSVNFGGFRSAIITIGFMNLLATILVIVFLEDEKQFAARGIQLKGDEPIRIKHIPAVLKWPGTWILGIGYFCTYMPYVNISYFNPYLIDVIGIDPDASSVYSVIRSYGAMIVAPFGGFMADKVLKSTSSWYAMAFAIMAVMFVVPLFFGPGTNVTFVCIYSVLPSLFAMSLYAVTYSIARECHFNPIIFGTANGLSVIFGLPIDGLFPTMFGSWLDNYGNVGYTYIFYTLIASCILGIGVAFWAKSHHKKCVSGQRVMNLGKSVEQ